jgi:hypothetical protein
VVTVEAQALVRRSFDWWDFYWMHATGQVPFFPHCLAQKYVDKQHMMDQICFCQAYAYFSENF